jgi:hypothetical protein
MNSEWVEYEKGARERAESVRRSDDPDIRAAIAAVESRKRRLAVAAARAEVDGFLGDM